MEWSEYWWNSLSTTCELWASTKYAWEWDYITLFVILLRIGGGFFPRIGQFGHLCPNGNQGPCTVTTARPSGHGTNLIGSSENHVAMTLRLGAASCQGWILFGPLACTCSGWRLPSIGHTSFVNACGTGFPGRTFFSCSRLSWEFSPSGAVTHLLWWGNFFGSAPSWVA